MNIMKRVILGMSLAVLACACSRGTQEQKGSGDITLRFSYWGGDARMAVYKQIVERYMEDTPGVRITLEPSSFNDYFTKLSTQMAGGGAPDLISMHPRYLKNFSSNGALFALDDLTASKEINIADFSQPSLNIGKIDGKLWMISTGTVAHGLFVNEAIFEELQIPLSRFEGLDWEGYRTLAIEVSQKSGGKYYGTADESFVPNDVPFTMFMRCRGKDFFTPEGGIGFDKEDLKAWLTLYENLRAGGGVPPAQHSGEVANLTWEQSDQVKGVIGFWFLNANRLKIYQDQMPNHPLIMVRGPHFNGRYGEYLDGSGLSINAKTPHKEAAARFINYWVNNKRSLELFKIEHGFPASAEMNRYVYDLLDAPNKLASQFMDTVTAGGTLPDYILPPNNWTDILNLIGQESQEVAFKTKTIDKAVEDFFAAVGRL